MLFVSEDKMTQDLSQDATRQMKDKLALLDTPKFSELYKEEGAEFERLPPFTLASMDSPALICHSSGKFHTYWSLETEFNNALGSTSFPKPITVTFKALAQWCLLPCGYLRLLYLYVGSLMS